MAGYMNMLSRVYEHVVQAGELVHVDSTSSHNS